MSKVGVLSCLNEPTLPFIMAALYSQGVKDVVIIADQKIVSDKNMRIWRNRTGGSFERVEGASLYALEKDAPPVYMVRNHNSDNCLKLIERLELTCLVNGSTPRKLNKSVLESVPQGVISVHPGLLPEYRGCCCVEWAILNNDKIGNTAFFMTEGYDEGPVITSEWYEFPKDTDYQSIRIRTMRDGFILLGKAVMAVVQTSMTPKDGIVQGQGKYWKPMSDDDMKAVLHKIQSQQYKYANL